MIGAGLAALAVSQATAQQTPVPAPTAASPAAQAAQAEDAGADEPSIIIRGTRTLPGSVIGDIPPQEQLGPADIRSYGVSSVSDLLNELSAQTVSAGGGPPIVLLNGRRISGAQEIGDLPTEAIARTEIFPEELSLKYGYGADQRVVNIVLRRRFRAATVELADQVPTAGGRNQASGTLDLLNISDNNRLQLDLKYNASSILTEAERDTVEQPGSLATQGNVSGVNGDVLDPRLGSATVAGVPPSAATGGSTLVDFATTTGRPNAPDQARYRSLEPSQRQFSANAVYTRSLGTAQLTINGTLEVNNTNNLLGLASAILQLPVGNPYSPFANPVIVSRALSEFSPLQQQSSSISTRVAASAIGELRGGWLWTITGNYERAVNDTTTDLGFNLSDFQSRIIASDHTANPFLPLSTADVSLLPANSTHSLSSGEEVNGLITGSPFRLPAGPVNTSVRIGASTTKLASQTFRSDVTTPGSISRDIGSAQLNIDLPIASRTRDALAAIGSLSLNGNFGVEHVSGFGTLRQLGYGLNWAPSTIIRFIASHTDSQDAPSATQLGNPVAITPNVRVFDYVTNATATVTRINGGNPNLLASDRHSTRLGVTLKPLKKTQLTLQATYSRIIGNNRIFSLANPIQEIQAALPGRFIRDAEGALLQIDSRPINFFRQEQSQLRYGFDLSIPLKSSLQKRIDAFRARNGPNPFTSSAPNPVVGQGRSGNARGPAGTGLGGRDGGSGRLRFALFHTWRFTDRVEVTPKGPVIDRLSGETDGTLLNGQFRHSLEGQAGYSNNGLGARATINFQSATTVKGGTTAIPTRLNFSSLTTVNLRLFADTTGRLDWVLAHRWMRGARITLEFNNILNQRQDVRDQAGAVPISFQPAYLDRVGRTARFSVRKLFY